MEPKTFEREHEDMRIITMEEVPGVWVIRISAGNTLLDSLTGPHRERLEEWAVERVATFAAFPLLRRDRQVGKYMRY